MMSALPPEPLPAAAQRGDAYNFEQQLGCGANGAVWRASRRDDDEQVAFCVKVVYNVQAGLRTNELSRRYETEFRLLEDQTRLPVHENIIRVFDHFNDDPVRLGLPDWRDMKKLQDGRQERPSASGLATENNLFIAMELMDTDLHKWSNVRRTEKQVCPFFTDLELFVIIEQVSCALCHLKQHKIVHRDIKPDNILIKGMLHKSNSGQVKLGDFGEHWDAFAFAEGSGSGFVMKNSGQTPGGRGAGGALYALAPEVRQALQDRRDVDYLHNDIWALGHSVWTVAGPGDQSPFPGSHRDLSQFSLANYLDLPGCHGQALRTLLRDVLVPDPDQRLPCEEVVVRARDWIDAEASQVPSPLYASSARDEIATRSGSKEVPSPGSLAGSKALCEEMSELPQPVLEPVATRRELAVPSQAPVVPAQAPAVARQELALPLPSKDLALHSRDLALHSRDLAVQNLGSTELLKSSSCATWGIARRGGHAIDRPLEGGVQQIYSTYTAFAALMRNGSVVTWGVPASGGDSSKVRKELSSGVQQIFSTYTAFAALKTSGSVVTWGAPGRGGDSSAVQKSLARDVKHVFATSAAFAALKTSGEVITWGDAGYGSDSRGVVGQLRTGVKCIFPSSSAFAALKKDGSVVTWDASGTDEAAIAVKDQLSSGVQYIFSTASAFAALKSNGAVVTWGVDQFGGDSSMVQNQLQGDVVHVFSTYTAFAALKADGSVVTWGAASRGGDSRAVQQQLAGGVVHIYSTDTAFAALRVDGSVVTWGVAQFGGDSSLVQDELAGDVQVVFSTCTSFAAVKSDGSVVTWGDALRGGDSSAVWEHLQCDVVHVYSTDTAFAALKADGAVVTWGAEQYGGDSSSVWGELDSNVARIYSTDTAFAAVKVNGSVITWGALGRGGDSSSVHKELASGDATLQLNTGGDTVDALLQRVSQTADH